MDALSILFGGVMDIKQFFTPIKGCHIYASDKNPYHKFLTRLGEVISVSGNIVYFKNRAGEVDTYIWKFKTGYNSHIVFGA